MTQPTLFNEHVIDGINSISKSDRLLRVFEEIHNHIYANEGLSSEQTFAEMMKVLALKSADEKSEGSKLFFVRPEELDGIDVDALSAFEKRINELQKQFNAYMPEAMVEKEGIKLHTSTLAYAVNRLQHIDLFKSSRDVKGLAFQKFVCSEHRKGRGQFFTPEQVVDLCVRLLQPCSTDKILDPACGTGGFLSQVARFITDTSDENTRKSFLNAHGSNIYGLEINPMVARTARVRLSMEDMENSNIVVGDALSDWPTLNHTINRATASNSSYEGFFDLILTNPPFGTQGRITSKTMLGRFDLGHKWVMQGERYCKTESLQASQVPDVLFIERCLDFLRVGGRMAIVLPNGDLENSSQSYLRSFILERADILAITHLPFDTFVPFGTGVKASILFLQKRDPLQTKQKRPDVFFGKITKLGYQANKNGNTVYKKNIAGSLVCSTDGTPLVDEDASVVVENYFQFRKNESIEQADACFSLPAEAVRDRFDLEYYKPSHRSIEMLLRNKSAMPLGEVADILKRRSPKLQKSDQEVLYIELTNVNIDYCEISGGNILRVHELPSRASFELQEGDIITAVAGNSIGTERHMSAIVTKEFEGAICTNGFRILCPKSNLNMFYLLFYLRTPYFLQQVFRYRTGAAIPAISDDDLAKILIYLPSKRVQETIASKVIEGFELRQKSRRLMKEIDFSIT